MHWFGRVGWGVALLFLLSLLTFVAADLSPGDFFSEMRFSQQLSPEQVAALRARYGLDGTLAERYLSWLHAIARGEFGFSWLHNQPVGPLLWRRLRNTLLLVASAWVLAWSLALPLGLRAALRGGWFDRLAVGASALLLATPQILLALVGLWLAAKSQVLPLGGMTAIAALDFSSRGWWGQLSDLVRHLALPASVLALGLLPTVFQHLRTALLEVKDAPYLQAARGHGIRGLRFWLLYALPAAANPMISLLGLSLGSLLSAAVLIEVVWSWPGLGPLLLEAMLARDLHVVTGVVLISGGLLIAANLLADGLLLLSDPRIRRGLPARGTPARGTPARGTPARMEP